MITTTTVLITVFLLVLAVVAFFYLTAAEGWQDADGFHFGKQPRPTKEMECK